MGDLVFENLYPLSRDVVSTASKAVIDPAKPQDAGATGDWGRGRQALFVQNKNNISVARPVSVCLYCPVFDARKWPWMCVRWRRRVGGGWGSW